MIYSEEDYPQGSELWLGVRLAKLTASKIHDATAKQQNGKYYKARENYMKANIAEKLTGISQDAFVSSAMKWGVETEPQARAAYEFAKDVEVKQVAFADHPAIPMSGASPDGLVGDKGLLEIKCPNMGTHLDRLATNEIPQEYLAQMQWQMACLDREWCDFLDFDPRMPEHLNKLIIRVERDDKYIQEMEIEVIKFNSEIDEKLKILEKM